MGTHAIIAIQYNDTIQAVYCHWDGYFEGVGKILTENYKTEEKIDLLMSYGEISSLAPEIADCRFYERDMNYDYKDSKVFTDNIKKSAKEMLTEYAKSVYAEYIYLFVEGVWHMGKANS
jgi:hypothetical protein